LVALTIMVSGRGGNKERRDSGGVRKLLILATGTERKGKKEKKKDSADLQYQLCLGVGIGKREFNNLILAKEKREKEGRKTSSAWRKGGAREAADYSSFFDALAYKRKR